jgi:Domain of unknown function (DUF4331)
MSSHKEAPAIAKDPAADSADLYAFVSPDAPDMVTIIANYVPLQDPDGGPNFFEFGAKTVVGTAAPVGDDVLYQIHIDNTGTGIPSITYQFQFTTTILNPNTFLYATGPITYSSSSGYSSTWNRRQTYSITKILTDVKTGDSTSTVISPPSGFACPPCNVGIRTTPNYASLSGPAIWRTSDGEIVFAGQRADGFFVDLGSIFDLGDLRPISTDHLIPGANTPGINSLADKNVHSIALQIPISSLTPNGQALSMGANDPNAVIGVYTTANRQTVRMFDPTTGVTTATGPYDQVSRLGNPLVNEVVVPMASKDFFNSQPPVNDSQFAAAVEHPELQNLLPVLYPGALPNLAAYTKARADLVAIFATGIPGSVIGSAFGVGTYQGGKVIAEMLRLNMGVAPTSSNGTQSGTSNLGLLGNDLAGFPNGRRPTDDVVTIALMAVAGATIPLTDKSYTPDKDVSVVNQGVTASPRSYQAGFPYLADPHGGFSNPTATPTYNTNPEL